MSIKFEFKKYATFSKFYDNGDPSHDWSHIIRVISLCDKLSSNLDVNARILVPAAVLHDVVNVPKDSIHRSNASTLAANKAKLILKDFDFNKNELESIGQIIIEHSYSANHKASSIESEILQDADKLDSLGAIGLMRWSTVGTRMGAAYYHPEQPFSSTRKIDDKKYSVDHFEAKLFNIYEKLNTEAAKVEGKIRQSFMQSFINQLKSEINISQENEPLTLKNI